MKWDLLRGGRRVPHRTEPVTEICEAEYYEADKALYFVEKGKPNDDHYLVRFANVTQDEASFILSKLSSIKLI